MLIRVSIDNVLSYDATTTFSMEAGKITKQHTNHVTKVCGLSLLRGAIIYGPNAAGKSNFIRAVNLFLKMFQKGTCDVVAGSNFRLATKPRNVMKWEFIFSRKNEVYRYSLQTNGQKVFVEELFRVCENGEQMLFHRKGLSFRFGEVFEGDPWYGGRTFAADGLLLCKLDQDGVVDRQNEIIHAELIANAIEEFSSYRIIRPKSVPNAYGLGMLLRVDEFKSFLKRILKVADLGIDDVVWRPCGQRESEFILARINMDQRRDENGVRFIEARGSMWGVSYRDGKHMVYELTFVHNGIPMRICDESDGTVRLFHLSAFLYSLRDHDMVWFVDEIDCHMHPYVMYYLLKEFMSLKGAKSQIVLTAHDTMLMNHEIWRTDEVWFAEKRVDGSSDLYSLYQYTPRFDKKLEKGYRQGLYGAIPHMGGEMLYGAE